MRYNLISISKLNENFSICKNLHTQKKSKIQIVERKSEIGIG